MRKKLALLVVGAVAGLAIAATASATPPTIVRDSIPRHFPAFYVCPGFNIRGDFQVDRTTTTYYDQSGAAVRSVTTTTDLVTGERTINGRMRVDTAPGEGHVIQVTGHIVFEPDGTIFEGGPHDDLDGHLDDLCGYLAGP
jgi:hypothetical protein